MASDRRRRHRPHRTGGHRADAVVVAVPPLLADAHRLPPGLPHRRAGGRHRARLRGEGPPRLPAADLARPRAVRLVGQRRRAAAVHCGRLAGRGGAGVLTGFVTGAEAHRFGALTAAEQRAEAVAQAGRIFPMLPAPIGVHVTDWVNEPYSRGCYAALFGPGDWQPARAAPHHPARPGALGGHRDEHRVLRAHGRRDPFGAPGRHRDHPRQVTNEWSTLTDESRPRSLPLRYGEKFMTEPDLGAGNFLDYALAANPNRDVPFVLQPQPRPPRRGRAARAQPRRPRGDP